MSKHRAAQEGILRRLQEREALSRKRQTTLGALRELHEHLGGVRTNKVVQAAVERMAETCQTKVIQGLADRIRHLERSGGMLTRMLEIMSSDTDDDALAANDELHRLHNELYLDVDIDRQEIAEIHSETMELLLRAESGDATCSGVIWDQSYVLNHEYRPLMLAGAFKREGSRITEAGAIEWTVLARTALSSDPSDDLWCAAFERIGDKVLESLRPLNADLDGFILGVPLRRLLEQTFQGTYIESEFGTDFPNEDSEVRHQYWIDTIDSHFIRIAEVALAHLGAQAPRVGNAPVSPQTTVPAEADDPPRQSGLLTGDFVEEIGELESDLLRRATQLPARAQEALQCLSLATSEHTKVEALEKYLSCGSRSVEGAARALRKFSGGPLIKSGRHGYELTDLGLRLARTLSSP